MTKRIILFLILALAFWAGNVFAIGMMTKPIVVKDILRGQETLVKLTLLNSEDKEVVYGLKAEGQISGWVTFYGVNDNNLENPITEIKMKAKDFADVMAKLKVPEDAPNGEYAGEIIVYLASSGEIKDEQTSVSVAQQVSRKVAITVTDKEIIDLEVSVVPSNYGINSGKPLKIRIDYYNKGNVAMKPDVQLTIKKDENSIFNAIFPYPDSENPIKIKERKTLSYIEWATTGRENGKYRAEIKILNGGKVIAEKNFGFSIGYFKNSVWVSAVSFLSDRGGLGWMALGGALLLIVAALNFLTKKGLKFKKNT